MSLERVPQELRDLPQWVVADESGRPFDPKSGRPASVTDPSTWGTSEQAARALNGTFKHAGFVFTDADPYCGIDLDDKPDHPATPEEKELHRRIVEQADSYTEWSPSERGLHVIVKGRVPKGVHSSENVEVYSTGRYFRATGNVLRDKPIAERQELLDVLYRELKGAAAERAELVEVPEVVTDQDVFDMAMNAENGEKFDRLCKGEWQALGYPSQSEADLALLAMLAFYTPSNEQVKRLFRYSALGRREKAHRPDYLNRCLAKIRANEPPRVDPSGLLAKPAPRLDPSRRLFSWDEFKVPRRCTLALVDGLLGEGAHSTTFGESGSGKSFLTLELAVSVALGRPFLGRKTKQSPVVYFVGEGAIGMQKRVAAIATTLEVSPPILFFPYSFNVPEGVQEVLRLVAEAAANFGKPPGLVILDTVNCYFGEGDENSTRDMKKYVDASRRLLEVYPTIHVNHVHHTGKDVSRGLRGSSVFKAAVDTALECTKLGDGRFEVRVDKQKDGEEGAVFAFRLKSVEIEIAGTPDRSCVVEYDAPQAVPRAGPKLPLPPGSCLTAVQFIRELMKGGGLLATEIPYQEGYLAKWHVTFPSEKSDTRQKRAKAALEKLRDVYRAIQWQPKDKVIRILPPFHDLCIQMEKAE